VSPRSFRASSIRLAALALSAAALATSSASAQVSSASLGHRADLRFGPLVGGEDVRFDLRTTAPGAPVALLLALDGTPSIFGFLPPFGLNLLGPSWITLASTDANGRLALSLSSTPGSYGPPGSGTVAFTQALVLLPDGSKVLSNTAAAEVEPLPAFPGFLNDISATHLPPGADFLGGNTIAVADITHDGHFDLAIATDGDVRIWVGDGLGGFADESAARLDWPAGEAVATLALGDIDNDGRPDLLTGGGFDTIFSPPNRLHRNVNGVFVEDPSFPEGTGMASQIELADLNGNGFLDVLFANGSEGHLGIPAGEDLLFFNNGGQGFIESFDFRFAAWNEADFATTAMRAGDVDDDGDLDLFIGKADTSSLDGIPGQPNILLLNDGVGNFEDVSAIALLPLASDNTQDAVFADIDGDGDLDIVVANSVLGVSTANSNDVLINQGGLQGGTTGIFHDDPASFLESSVTADGVRLSVHAGDVDADGDVDFLLTTHDLFTGADQMLFLNQGGAQGGTEGTFVRQFWFDPPFSGSFGGLGDFICWGAAMFDADHDGDLEIMLMGNGVVGGDPSQALVTRYLLNSKL